MNKLKRHRKAASERKTRSLMSLMRNCPIETKREEVEKAEKTDASRQHDETSRGEDRECCRCWNDRFCNVTSFMPPRRGAWPLSW